MSHQQELLWFIQGKLKDQGINGHVGLTEDTPLLTSNLLSSLTLLELAMWIEERISTPIDLKTIEPVKEWNTINDILRFIKKQSCDEKVWKQP